MMYSQGQDFTVPVWWGWDWIKWDHRPAARFIQVAEILIVKIMHAVGYLA